MRKLKLVVAAFALSMLLGTTAFAAYSPMGNIGSGTMVIGSGTFDGRFPVGTSVTCAAVTDEGTLQSLYDYKEANYPGYGAYVAELSLSGAALEDGEAVCIRISVPVHSTDNVKVLHYDSTAGKWEERRVRTVGDGYVDADFDSLSPVAVLVTPGSGSKKKSSSSSKQDDTPEPWYSSVTPAATTQTNGVVANVNIGPGSRTLYESDAQAAFGTAQPCSVYMMDIWLTNVQNGDLVPVGPDGAVLHLNVPDVTTGSRVIVRHWLNGTDQYEDLTPSEIGNGYIKVKFSSLSPVAVMVTGGGPAAAGNTGTAAAGKVSPKTGEDLFSFAGVLAAAGLLGMVYFKKKSVMK